jgi:hypothetical protein
MYFMSYFLTQYRPRLSLSITFHVLPLIHKHTRDNRDVYHYLTYFAKQNRSSTVIHTLL